MAPRLPFRTLRHKLLAALLLPLAVSALTCAIALALYGADPVRVITATVVVAVLAPFAVWRWLRADMQRSVDEMAELARRTTQERNSALRAAGSVPEEFAALAEAFNASLAETARRAEALEAQLRRLERELE